MIPLEADYSGIFVIIFIILLLPPIVLAAIGFLIRKKYKDAATVFYILAVLYLIVGLGICFGGF
ncbi:hypothetical protein EV195_10470 [Tenacibaculum skagerrakense]|uniref:Phospholipase D-like protein n=1 Tax=Tenacibaculum skagerrakense TaxID=186571 RepID=A0A4R2NST7_9FLAO|nr:hypothetical protein [Tenacibaculum skagerrakense]TCP25039.1 hypothetical protein EV195_10470 [Tenacibaculum skagerrakense]